MDVKPNEHHLVMGELKDLLTGQVLPDTHDERYRQKICDLLINGKGYRKQDIKGRVRHELKVANHTARIRIDFLIRHEGKTVALIKYAPGSLVTRRLSTLALSRTIEPYQIPVVVVTNGEDAEIVDGASGKVDACGLAGIPDRSQVAGQFHQFSFAQITPAVFDQASRIAFACEVNGACPCDTDICILENQ